MKEEIKDMKEQIQKQLKEKLEAKMKDQMERQKEKEKELQEQLEYEQKQKAVREALLQQLKDVREGKDDLRPDNFLDTEALQEKLVEKYQKALRKEDKENQEDTEMADAQSPSKQRLRWDQVKVEVHGSPSKLRMHGEREDFDQKLE